MPIDAVRNESIDDKVRRLKAIQETMEGKTGVVHDMDTVLADITEDMEHHVSGIGLELIGLYEDADNKDQFAQLFQSLTGVAWSKYLDRSEAALHDTLNGKA